MNNDHRQTIIGRVNDNNSLSGELNGGVNLPINLSGKLTPTVRMTGNLSVGIIRYDEPTSFLLVDEEGNELAALLVEEEIELSATANDIRQGTTAITDDGFTEGTKVIPAYHTVEGFQIITPGGRYVISTLVDLDQYDFTKMQAMLCELNTDINDSVSVVKISLNEQVYEVKSTIPISTVTRDYVNKHIDFGLINDSGTTHILRYFTYKEIK